MYNNIELFIYIYIYSPVSWIIMLEGSQVVVRVLYLQPPVESPPDSAGVVLGSGDDSVTCVGVRTREYLTAMTREHLGSKTIGRLILYYQWEKIHCRTNVRSNF